MCLVIQLGWDQSVHFREPGVYTLHWIACVDSLKNHGSNRRSLLRCGEEIAPTVLGALCVQMKEH